MKKVQIIICASVILLLNINNKSLAQGAAQEREYTRQREAARVKSANEASLKQNAANNAPVEGKWGYATGVFDKRSTGGGTQMSAETRAGLERLYAERRAESERIGKEAAEDVRLDAGQTMAYNKYYESLGVFNSYDAGRLRDFTIKYPGKVSKNAAYYLTYADIYKRFQQVAATGTFNEVMSALEPLAVLPYTAFPALQKLEKRFPEKQRAIDLAKLQVLYNYYGSVTSPEGFTSYAMGKYGEGPDHQMMSDNFFRLARMYPDSVASALYFNSPRYLSNNPYIDAIGFLSKDRKKNAAEILRLQEEFLQYPSKEIISRAYNYCWGFITIQDLPYLKKMAAKHGVKPLDLILLQSGSQERAGYFIGRRKYGTRYQSTAKDYFTPTQKKGIKTLAEEGDPEAVHLYGLRIAQGWEDEKKEESLKWIKAAAEKDTPYAKENLDDICWWGIKGLKDYCTGINKVRK